VNPPTYKLPRFLDPSYSSTLGGDNYLPYHPRGCIPLPIPSCSTFPSGWYKVLEKFVVIKKSPILQTVARVAADQLAFAPVGIATFFAAMTVLEAAYQLMRQHPGS
jgi:hypothetical protein